MFWIFFDDLDGFGDINHSQTKPFGGVHTWGVSQNGWFIRENPIKTDDLWVFQQTPISIWDCNRVMNTNDRS